jgi:hypothetical protein
VSRSSRPCSRPDSKLLTCSGMCSHLHHLQSCIRATRLRCILWWRALAFPSTTWALARCSAAFAMPSCGRRKIRVGLVHPVVACCAAMGAKAAPFRTASSSPHS